MIHLDPVLVHVIIVLIVVGVLLGLINQIPMASQVKSIINGLVVLVIVVWLLQVFKILGPIGGYRLGLL